MVKEILAKLQFNGNIARMKDIPRILTSEIPRFQTGFPVIAVLGPRQSGKSTLVQNAVGDLPFVSFEDHLEQLAFKQDPHGFFAKYPEGAIVDEVQNVPDFFSALQVVVDAQRKMGRWILTGSQQLELTRGISQSLAGRVAMLELLPFSHAELTTSPRRPKTLVEAVFRGGYAPLYDENRQLDPVTWLDSHLQTLLGRDLRDLILVRDRHAFASFVSLCAAHSGMQLNQAEIATAIGVRQSTVTAWLSVLEATYLVKVLRPYERNFGKRMVKRPKIYFTDTGLACRLLHISNVNHLRDHPNWGALVETWCVMEVMKSFTHRGKRPSLWFWRTSDGHEVDLIVDQGARIVPIEIKATRSPDVNLARPIQALRRGASEQIVIEPGYVVYGGDESRQVGDDQLVPWYDIDAFAGKLS